MKQETILKGAELINQIEAAQKAKLALNEINNVELKSSRGSRLVDLFPYSETKSNWASFDGNSKIPQELKDLLKEETIRFLQRCKRHCDDLEFKLKQELEDLA